MPILGAGAGIGGNVGKKFAKEGYHTVLVRRSDEEGLNKLVDINDAGASAIGRLINAVEEDAIENLIVDIENNEGPIEVVVFNLGAHRRSDAREHLLQAELLAGDELCSISCGENTGADNGSTWGAKYWSPGNPQCAAIPASTPMPQRSRAAVIVPDA